MWIFTVCRRSFNIFHHVTLNLVRLLLALITACVLFGIVEYWTFRSSVFKAYLICYSFSRCLSFIFGMRLMWHFTMLQIWTVRWPIKYISTLVPDTRKCFAEIWHVTLAWWMFWDMVHSFWSFISLCYYRYMPYRWLYQLQALIERPLYTSQDRPHPGSMWIIYTSINVSWIKHFVFQTPDLLVVR